MPARRLTLLSPVLLLLALFLVVPAYAGGEDGSSDSEPGENGTPGDEDSSSGDPDDVPGAVRYLAIGDSVSQGVGADDLETQSMPARLAQRWRGAGCKVVLLNAAISGYTAGQMLEEQVPLIPEFKPTIITFQSGANDIVNGVTPAQYRNNVGAVLDAATASGAKVFVQYQNEWFRTPEGVNYGAPRAEREAYDIILAEVAAAKGATIVDLRPLYKLQADRQEWIDDGLHPTAAAYDAWAEQMAANMPLPCAN